MTTDQLRASAEQIVEHHKSAVAVDSYCEGALKLAKAWLAEHADSRAAPGGAELPSDDMPQTWQEFAQAMVYSLKHATGLRACGYNEYRCESLGEMPDETGCTEADYVNAAERIENSIRKSLLLAKDAAAGNWHPATSAPESTDLRAEVERLRQALTRLSADAKCFIDLHAANGPQWTIQGAGYYDEAYMLAKMQDVVDAADAALETKGAAADGQ